MESISKSTDKGARLMVKHIIFIAVLFFSTNALANDKWEYQVIILPGSVSGSVVSKQSHGGYFDSTKTDILNKLGAESWELISVTGQSGADHVAYLRRRK